MNNSNPNRFDDELKLALRREQPSPDFTDRVMTRIAQLPAPESKGEGGEGRWREWGRKVFAFFEVPKLGWATAGALAVVLFAAAFGVMRYREHQIELRRLA